MNLSTFGFILGGVLLNAAAQLALKAGVRPLGALSLGGPTGYAINPARDLGPRMWSALAGWGPLPFSINGQGWFWVYVMAPLAGGQLAAIFYRAVLRPAYAAPPT